MKTGIFVVHDGKLEAVGDDPATKSILKLEGQVFHVTLDDECPLNDRQRAMLFAHTKAWIESLPDPVRKMFWRFFHQAHYAPVDPKTVIDTLKAMYGIKSIANARCSRQQLSDFVRWAMDRMDEISAAAQNVRDEEER